MGHYDSCRVDLDAEYLRSPPKLVPPTEPFIVVNKIEYDKLLDRIAQLEQLKSKPISFEVNGQMLEFHLGLDDSHQSNLAIICNGVYIVGITPDGKLARYVTYPTDGDAFQVNKEGQVKIDKDNFY